MFADGLSSVPIVDDAGRCLQMYLLQACGVRRTGRRYSVLSVYRVNETDGPENGKRFGAEPKGGRVDS